MVIDVTDNNGSVCTKKLASGKSLTIERSKITPASFTVENFIPCNLEAVDMGLSVLWAIDKEYTEYSASGKTVLDPEHDVAHVKWGGDWRMPTQAEIAELFDATKTEWSYVNYYGEEINGVKCYNGMKITSKTTGKSIFLKSTGYYKDSGLEYNDSEGLYWSSTICGNDSAYRLKFSYPYNTSKGYHERHDVANSSFRYCGLPVRPVCDKPSSE